MTVEELRKQLLAAHVDPHFVIQHEGQPVDLNLDIDPVKETINLTITKKF